MNREDESFIDPTQLRTLRALQPKVVTQVNNKPASRESSSVVRRHCTDEHDSPPEIEEIRSPFSNPWSASRQNDLIRVLIHGIDRCFGYSP